MFDYEYEEMMTRKIGSFGLCGRTIKRMRMVGMNYLHDRRTRELARTDLELPRTARIDEPFLIKFEDGDILSVFSGIGETECLFGMGMNIQEWTMKAVINDPNEDADILFAPCAGQKKRAAEIGWCEGDVVESAQSGDKVQIEPVMILTLWLENGFGLCFDTWLDFGVVECVDSQKNNVMTCSLDVVKAMKD